MNAAAFDVIQQMSKLKTLKETQNTNRSHWESAIIHTTKKTPLSHYECSPASR